MRGLILGTLCEESYLFGIHIWCPRCVETPMQVWLQAWSQLLLVGSMCIKRGCTCRLSRLLVRKRVYASFMWPAHGVHCCTDCAAAFSPPCAYLPPPCGTDRFCHTAVTHASFSSPQFAKPTSNWSMPGYGSGATSPRRSSSSRKANR